MDKSSEKLKECMNKLVFVDWILIVFTIVGIIIFTIILIKSKKSFFKIFTPFFIFALSIYLIVTCTKLIQHQKDVDYLNKYKPNESIVRLEGIEEYKSNLNGSISVKPDFINPITHEYLCNYTYVNIDKDKLKINRTYTIAYTPYCKIAYIIYE